MTRGLDAHVAISHLGLDVAFTAEPGQVVGVVGPPHAGKSAIMRAIAGLDLHDGTIVFGEEVWDDHGRQRVRTPRRGLGMVLADPLLLPQLDVRSNIAVAIDRGEAGDDALAEADVWVDALGLSEVGHRRPRQLSTGQAQRVSLGRALAGEPRLLLLDDPLARLDARTRAELRRLLSHSLRRFEGPTVVVTRDPIDAYALADRLVVIEEGAVTQEGDLRTVTRRPGSDWAAARVGLNLYRGQVLDGAFHAADGGHTLRVTTDVRGPALAMIPPHAVSLFRGRPIGSPRNVWHGGVVGVDGRAGRMRVSVVGRLPIVAEVTTEAVAELQLGNGGGIWVSIKATEIEVHPD